MSKADLGEKQTCPECEAKFYDLKKNPAICPKCGHTFDPLAAITAKHGKGKEADETENETTDDSDEDQVETKTPDDEDDDGIEEVPEIDAEADSVALGEDEEDDTPGSKQRIAEPSVEDEIDEDEAGMSIVDDDEDLPDLDDDDDIDLGDDEDLL